MATREEPHLEAITPVNRTAENNQQPSKAVVVRKLYILNDRTIIAFSGNDSREIKRCLEAVDGALPSVLRAAVPMDALAAVVETFSTVDAVAATILGDGRIDLMSRVGHRFETKALGHCATIGSGSAALRRRAELVDRKLEEELHAHPVERALGFARNVASICFAREIGGEVFDWGACMEYAYAEEGALRWSRGPKTIHLFCALHRLDERRATASIVQRRLFYDPGGDEGRLLNFGMGPDGVQLVDDMIIRSILDPSLDLDRADSPTFWNAWRPDRVSIAMLTGLNGGIVATATNDFPADICPVEIDWPRGMRGPQRLAIRFPDDVYRDFCGQVAGNIGYEFVPPSELSDEVRASLTNAAAPPS